MLSREEIYFLLFLCSKTLKLGKVYIFIKLINLDYCLI